MRSEREQERKKKKEKRKRKTLEEMLLERIIMSGEREMSEQETKIDSNWMNRKWMNEVMKREEKKKKKEKEKRKRWLGHNILKCRPFPKLLISSHFMPLSDSQNPFAEPFEIILRGRG